MPDYLEAFVATPWILAIVFVVAGLDALVPLSPSEGTVVAVSVVAAGTGQPHLMLIIAVAAGGAYTGDYVSYRLGARGGARLVRRLHRTPRGRAAYDWAWATMRRRGGAILLFARYLPLGRSASTLAAGAVGYPPARFRVWTGAGVAIWATFAALVGHWGGTTFDDQPVKGMVIAYAVIAALLAGGEAGRQAYQRLSARRAAVDS